MDDVYSIILNNLPIEGRMNCMLTCKIFNKICTSESSWKTLLDNRKKCKDSYCVKVFEIALDRRKSFYEKYKFYYMINQIREFIESYKTTNSFFKFNTAEHLYIQTNIYIHNITEKIGHKLNLLEHLTVIHVLSSGVKDQGRMLHCLTNYVDFSFYREPYAWHNLHIRVDYSIKELDCPIKNETNIP